MVLVQLLMLWFYTITTISVLQRVGWITIHLQNVRNDKLRKVFEIGVQLGDTIVAKTLDLIAMVSARGGGNGGRRMD